ncbi:nucleoside triphosphate pyrophosphohydrolase [Aestuariibacter salexigens]|uniref:nucleoside triphosphate pyrophosphohydrolase n=1 Tax=Aestuariibacter salexigens TaxID=226010 RepID=UPI0003F84F65|nr:nucleoside triphosphate pyrophosphohydrolase [Aestuariibacter salexigens]
MSSGWKTDMPSQPVAKLLWVMKQLRDPHTGCPWDLKQDFASIVPHTIEEAYEVADAIEHGSMEDIKDELGDLLFQVVFYAQLGEEQDAFDFNAVAATIAEKLIRRHPHVFAQQQAESDEQLAAQWDAIKQQERAAKGKQDDSVLANIPVGLAPLIRAQKLQKKCAKVGFDWPDAAPVVDKIHEEIEEVLDAVQSQTGTHDEVEEEIGDLLFAVVNLSRHLGVDAETALRKANNKFERRFRHLEQSVSDDSVDLRTLSLEQLESYWCEAKSQLKQRD